MLASNVTVIQPTIVEEKKTYDIIHETSAKRVCAYCRVSTDSAEQKNSYDSQCLYYTEYIKNHPGWIFTKIYADEGITGTSMRKRTHFREMIQDALDGKIDMILCKSISRFARNVVDILNIIEQLNQKGVPILFENENLNSLDDRQGTRLQILISAANAEDYSQALSESIKWGRIRQIEQGKYPISHCYGYNVKNKKITVNQREAEVVKFIYQTFLNGDTYRNIARTLEERGVPSPGGKAKWHASAIQDILENVRYKGDLHLQKTVISDIKFRKQIKNEKGKQYYIADHHVAIIPKAQWNQAEKERLYRANLRGFGKSGKAAYTSKYPLSGMIYCLQCGSKFRKHYNRTSKGKIATWVCDNHKRSKQNCTQTAIVESRIEEAFVKVFNDIVQNKEQVIETILNNIDTVLKERKEENTIAQIDAAILVRQNQLMTLVQGISTMDTLKQSQQIMDEIAELKKQKDEAKIEARFKEMDAYRIEELKKQINQYEIFDTFNSSVFKQVVEKVLIDVNKAIFVFNNSLKVEAIVK